jgi:hypothetical protein
MLVAEAYVDTMSFSFFKTAAEEARECYAIAYGNLSNVKNGIKRRDLSDRLLFIGMAPTYIITESGLDIMTLKKLLEQTLR